MNKSVLITAFAGLLLIASSSFAQLPELGMPSTVTGADTTAQFYGGATADGGTSYASSFGYDQAIDILTEIHVESAHVNTMGNLYVIIEWDGVYFVRDEAGVYQTWDLTLPTMLPATTLL